MWRKVLLGREVLGRRREAKKKKRNARREGRTLLKFSVWKKRRASSRKQVFSVKDKGNRKRTKLGRKAKDLKRKICVSGVPLMKMRRRRCWNIWRTMKMWKWASVNWKNCWKRRKKQVYLSYGLPHRQGMREAKSSSRSSGKKRIKCTSCRHHTHLYARRRTFFSCAHHSSQFSHCSALFQCCHIGIGSG